MSVFDNAYQWPDQYKACGAPHQSPVNLSQSFALPCERLCEWKVDDTAVGSAGVGNEQTWLGGLYIGDFQNGKPTATFNGDGYTCEYMVLFPTGQHSIEGVFGDAELVCVFVHPQGKTVCMSVSIRSSPGDTPSSKFFNAVVPYVHSAGENQWTNVKLGDSWSIQDVIPDTPSYYIYTGTTIWPGCQPNVTWIVYSNTVTIDPSDYAKLTQKVKVARRPLEEVADREVTFFDAQGMSTPRDGKLYMRCRRVAKKQGQEGDGKETQKVQSGGLQDAVLKKAKEVGQAAQTGIFFTLFVLYINLGGIYGILTFLSLLGTACLLFLTSAGKNLGLLLFAVMYYIPDYIHRLVGSAVSSAGSTITAARTSRTLARAVPRPPT